MVIKTKNKRVKHINFQHQANKNSKNKHPDTDKR